MSIRARLLLLILFSTLIPMAVSGWHFFDRRESEIAAVRQDLAATAKRIAHDLRDTIRSTAQLHYGLSRARDLDTQDRAACSEFLANVLREYPQYTGILTITPKGDLFCDSLGSGRQLHLTDRRYFQQALASENPLAVEPAFGRLTGMAVLQVAYAARRETGEPRFVLLASVDLEKFMQFSSRTLPRENEIVALVDDKGTVLTWHPNGEKLRGTTIADTPLFGFARERQGVAVRENIEVGGVPSIWAASGLSEFSAAGLHILAGISRRDLLAAANRNLMQALAILVAVWLLVCTGAWILVEAGIRRPIARIIAVVTRFSGGHFDARIGKPYPRGEIGKLMSAMDYFFGLMRAQRDVIQGHTADLESRVARRTAQLEAANRELESFSYSVSHDLRAPLRAIDGFGQRLLDSCRDKMDANATHYLNRIRAGTQTMAQLIDDLIDLSRITRAPLKIEPVNLGALAQRIAGELRQGEPQREVEFSCAGEAIVQGDERLLGIALRNLLDNAWKFTAKRKRARIEFGVTQRDHATVYFVRDNGAGFDMAYTDKLFSPFQRLHSTAEFPGTGIGLATVQRILHRHGGRIWAEAELDQGATFFFTFGNGAGT